MLGSPRGSSDAAYAAHRSKLRERLAHAGRTDAGLEVWVTHQFVLSDLLGGSINSGEGLVLRADAGGVPQVLARLKVG